MDSEEETRNWTKASIGLLVTKIGLSTYIIQTWKDHLQTWTREEIYHLPNFFEDVRDGKIVFAKEKGRGSKQKTKGSWNIRCTCREGLCQTILDRLLKLHVNPGSKNIVWNPYEQSQKKSMILRVQSPNRRPYVSYLWELCFVCKEYDCPFERHRKGVPLFDSKEYNIVDRYYWKIANLFMFHGKEKNSIPNTGPEDTDSALIFKMMKNCKLFTFDKDDDVNEGNEEESDDTEEEEEEVEEEDEEEEEEDTEDKEDDAEEADNETYDELLEVRNFIMHTPDNRLSDEALEECFKQMKIILRAKRFKDTLCKTAVLELSKLKSLSIILTSLTSQEASIVKQAFAEQQSALEYDINVTGKLKNDRVLEGILKVSVEKCKKYTEKQEQESDNSRVVPDPEQETPIREQRPDGAATAGGAATGAIVGSIAGPPGAVIGATIGVLLGKMFERR